MISLTDKCNVRTLVISNNPDDAEMLGWLIRQCGGHVRIVENGASALGLAATYAPHLAIIDLGMPLLGGFHLAKQFRASVPLLTTRLVGTSSYSDRASHALAQEAGFDELVARPYSRGKIERILQAAQQPPD